jgi:hypothetical protein
MVDLRSRQHPGPAFVAIHHRSSFLLRRIAVESFAGVGAELPLVNVVLLEKLGQASLLLIPRRVDVVDGVQPYHVEDLERTQRRAGSDSPCLVDGVRLGDPIHEQPERIVEP